MAQPKKELRIGLVLYGGVSLAVYMHGVVTEIWNALRASEARMPCSKRSYKRTWSFYAVGQVSPHFCLALVRDTPFSLYTPKEPKNMQYYEPTTLPLLKPLSVLKSYLPQIGFRLALTFGAFLGLVPTYLAAADAVEWNFSTSLDQTEINLDHMRLLANYISDNSGGKFSIKINDLSNKNSKNAISEKNLHVFSFDLQDLYYNPDGSIPAKWNSFPIFEMDYKKLYESYSEWKEDFQSSKNRSAIDILFSVPERTSYFVSNHRINSLRDLKGLSISTFTKNSEWVFSMLGMKPSMVPHSRALGVIQNYGDTETFSITPSVNIDMNIFKGYSYLYHIKPTWRFVATGIDRQLLESLPIDLKRIVLRASSDFEGKLWSQVADLDNGYSEKLQALGLQEISLLHDWGSDLEEKLNQYKRRKCPPYCKKGQKFCEKFPHLCVTEEEKWPMKSRDR